MKGAFALWKALPRTRPYLRPYRKLLIISIGLTIGTAAVSLAEPWPLAILVDSVLGDHPPAAFLRGLFGDDPNVYTLLVFAVLARFLLVGLGNALTVVNDYFNAKAEQHMVLDLRSDLFEHCQRLSLTFHDGRKTGALMSQINIQSAALGNIVMALPPIIEATLTLIGMLVIAVLIDWPVALVSLAVVPFLYWSFGIYGTRIVPRLQRVQQLEWQSLSIVHEAMAMLRVIVSFGREKHEHRRFREQGKTAVDERVRLTVSQNLYTLGVQTATAAGTSLVLGVGAWRVLQGDLTVGELLVLMAYIASVYQPLEQISTTVGTLHEQFVAFDATLNLLDTEPEVKEAPDAVSLGRARGELTVDGASFSYQGRADTISDVSFTARPGERIAVVGPTGAGKTTLMSLLIRFYDPDSGRILIDGVDISKVKLESLREQFSVVLQEPLLFSGTVAENIRYGQLDAPMEDVVEAAKAANCHDFISALPDGYETELGERGAKLSGGERQRICLARAFLKDAPVLILDEPTSSIDSRTEGVILDALDNLMVGRTSLIVAHRLSTVRHADLILVMNGGRLVESGTHAELLELDGVYRQLHKAQTRRARRARVRAGNGTLPAVPVGDSAPGASMGIAAMPYGNGHAPPPRAEPSVAEPAARRQQSPRPQGPGAPATLPFSGELWGFHEVSWRQVDDSADPIAKRLAALPAALRERKLDVGGAVRARLQALAAREGRVMWRQVGSERPRPAARELLRRLGAEDGFFEALLDDMRGGDDEEPGHGRRPPPDPVDLNSAGIDELTTLPGVGERAAARIVADRERRGPFASVSELTRVEQFDVHRVRRLEERAQV